MKLDKFALIVLFTLLIGGAAYFFSKQEAEQLKDQEAGDIYLKSLSQRINDVASISVLSKDSATNLTLEGDGWVVKEKNNYSADFTKVKKLLLDLADLKTIESKTNRPESYARLGVQDISASGEYNSTRIDLFDKAGNKLESVIIGKPRESRAPGSVSALYVRKADDVQSWLVSGDVKLPLSLVEWLNNKVVDVKASDIQRVAINHADGKHLIVEKATKEDKHFAVVDLPSAAKLKSESVADNLANGLSNLTFDDVSPRNSFNIGTAKPATIEYKTFDGLQVSVKLIENDKKHYVLLDTQANVEDDKVKQQAVKLGSQFAQWAYEISESKSKGMLKTLDDVVEKPEERAANQDNQSKD